jgi:hypothetical protein
MRTIDPSLELVACGSPHMGMPTSGAWEATVLEEAYDLVDFISCHAYYEELDGDLGSFLASAIDMDRFIDAPGGRRGPARRARRPDLRHRPLRRGAVGRCRGDP